MTRIVSEISHNITHEMSVISDLVVYIHMLTMCGHWISQLL